MALRPPGTVDIVSVGSGLTGYVFNIVALAGSGPDFDGTNLRDRKRHPSGVFVYTSS
jgi:hypothetical protein